MKQVSGKDFMRLLRQRGWQLARINGTHHIFTKPGHRSASLSPSTAISRSSLACCDIR
jgi:predicted RNA binding protein YcfA (HicA-like mRNA interferase family)